MDIKAQSLYAEMQALALQAQNPITPAPVAIDNPTSADFGDMLGQAIRNVSDMGIESKNMQQRFDMEDPNISLADVMVAKEKAGIAFEATVQVRNKVLEAYKSIMNMPI